MLDKPFAARGSVYVGVEINDGYQGDVFSLAHSLCNVVGEWKMIAGYNSESKYISFWIDLLAKSVKYDKSVSIPVTPEVDFAVRPNSVSTVF